MRKWTGPEIIAVVISLVAATFAGWQAWEAHQARKDSRQWQTEAREDSEQAQKLQRELAETAAKEAKRSADAAEKSAAALLATARTIEATGQLRLDPDIQVEAAFQEFGNPANPPRILLWKRGAADAVAMAVKLKLWVAAPLRAGVLNLVNDGAIVPDWQISRLPAGETVTLAIKPQATDASPHLMAAQQTRQPFIELAIRYLRPADRKEYEKRAYYFVSQDHRWVGENDPRSKTEMNKRIKNFLRKYPLWTSEFRHGLDLTHDVKQQAPKKP